MKKLDKCGKLYKINFNEWLVGFTDGDGCFNIYTNIENKKIIFTYRLGQKFNNKQILYTIKKNLGIGRVVLEKDMAYFIITRKDHLENIILPIFYKYNLLTSKEYKFLIFDKCFKIYLNNNLTQIEKINLINLIKLEVRPLNYIPTYILNNSKPIIIISKSWIVGFIEAEGSFYITKKDTIRYVHGFGITQKLDKQLLLYIKDILKIKSNVLYNKNGFYSLNCYNKNSLKYIKKYFFKLFKSRKALIYRIWARSFRLKGRYTELKKIQEIIRKLY